MNNWQAKYNDKAKELVRAKYYVMFLKNELAQERRGNAALRENNEYLMNRAFGYKSDLLRWLARL